MSMFERGPIQTYEVVWRSGHVETVQAHQVTYPHAFEMHGRPKARPVVLFHAEIAGMWLLTLSADEDDIQTIRLITAAEPIPAPDVTQ